MEDIIKKEKHFAHSIDKVWKAISEGAEISKWFINADFKPEVGYEYTFTALEEHGGTVVKGKVLEASPYNLKYTWRVGDVEVDTTVSWELVSTGDGTKLILEHSGASQYPEESAIEMMGHFEKGWNACLDGLSQYFNDEIKQPAH